MVATSTVLASLLSIFSLQSAAGLGVILPLYIYPTDGAWDNLYSALDAHSDLPFHVIVNPNSGPGDGAQPDAGYQSALTKLRAYKNAQLYGYVRSQYGERAKSDVVDDVNTYQAWDSAYSLDGIFFDEASNTADLESTYNYYAEAVVGKVILNPGTSTTDGYFGFADQIVTYESDWSSYEEPSLEHAAQESIIIHSYTGTSQELKSLITSLADQGAGSVYVTDLLLSEEDVYASFGDNWGELVADVASEE